MEETNIQPSKATKPAATINQGGGERKIQKKRPKLRKIQILGTKIGPGWRRCGRKH
jgi:hypothetical protein